MSGMGSERRLASIVALDVAGYSARTEADEAGTIAAIAILRGTIERIAHEHAGRIFNTAGDGFMLEFGSGLAAAQAAWATSTREAAWGGSLDDEPGDQGEAEDDARDAAEGGIARLEAV